MDFYNIQFKPSVEKDLRSLPKRMVGKVIAAIDSLQITPFPRHVVKLSGAERLYRIRVGDYRIIYEVDNAMQQIMVHYVRHRREVYRKIS